MSIKKKVAIAFQGEHGAFSEIAVHELVGKRATTMPQRSTEHVIVAVAKKACTHGMVMLENSTEGTLHYAYDLITRERLVIAGEIYLRIRHELVGIPTKIKGEKRLREIKRAYSHPQALAECADFFRMHPWIETVSAYDTAGMARMVAERKLAEESAVASTRAAKLYGLAVLADHIESKRENYVRFGLVTAAPARLPRLQGNKVSLIVTLAHVPGSLSRFLVQCAGRGMNLTKVESRPLLAQHNEYLFYVDFEHRFTPEVLRRTLDALSEEATSFTILGAYEGGDVHHLIDT